MHRRKIQLVAGTTYSLSLPKEWIKKNKLKEKKEVLIQEKNDQTLLISPDLTEKKELNEIILPIDEYINDIEQILFGAYYLGVENITLLGERELTKETKARIRKTLTNMSGTEIAYEDKKKIKIKVLLDKKKIDILQIIYRINLLIESSISNVTGKLNMPEIRINENEIDRLYHLMAKTVQISLTDSSILQSSRIKNISLIPAYFLISKRLENIGDNINHMAKYLNKNKIKFVYKTPLELIKKELSRSINYLLNPSKNFEKINSEFLASLVSTISKIKDEKIKNYFKETIRYMIDIEEEIVNITFYNKLIKENVL